MLLNSLRAYGRIIIRARRVPDLLWLLAKRPTLLAGVGAYEGALLVSGRVDGRLKSLAAIKTGSLVGCPF